MFRHLQKWFSKQTDREASKNNKLQQNSLVRTLRYYTNAKNEQSNHPQLIFVNLAKYSYHKKIILYPLDEKDFSKVWNEYKLQQILRSDSVLENAINKPYAFS